MSVVFVLYFKKALSDILDGVTSKKFFARSARVFGAFFLLCD